MQSLPGPSINVTFIADQGGISSILLDENNQQGCCWQCDSDDPGLLSKIDAWMRAYCKKETPKQKLPLNWTPFPPFTKRVLDALTTIPFGNLLTYKTLAESLKNQKASRAVGNACGRNPFPLVIPCHRVVATSKNALKLGGFSCGLSIKKKLLTFELTQPIEY